MHRNCLSKWFELGIQSHWFCVARYLWALLLCCRIVKSRANSSLLSSPALYSKSRYLKGTPITFFFFRSMLAISSPLLFYINFRISLWNSKQLPPPQKKKTQTFWRVFSYCIKPMNICGSMRKTELTPLYDISFLFMSVDCLSIYFGLL